MNADDFNMIIDFADGSLDPVKEDALFLKLNTDDELRQEFKAHMAVKNAVRTGASAVILPAVSKAAIFSQLGLTLPTAGTVVGSAGSLAAFIAFLTSRKTIATASVVLLLTALFFILNPGSENKTIQNPDKQFSGNNSQQAQIQNQIPSITSQEGRSTESHLSVNNSVQRKKITNNTDNTIAQDRTTDISSDDNKSIDLISMSNIKSDYSGLDIQNSATSFESINADYSGIDIVISQKSSFLDFEINGTNYRSTFKPTIEPGKYSNFNNLGLTALYKSSDNFGFGVNLRQETFFLRYRGTENSEQFIYEQQPNFTTFSAVAKYKLDPWNGFSPFAQVSGGMNSVGLVGRGMAGIQYSFMPNLSILLGFEYSYMLYTHQNNYFNSSKFGLNYGLMYSF